MYDIYYSFDKNDIEQVRQLAQNETTPPETLTIFGCSTDCLTRQYVASNPNTPIKILEQLAREFPNQIMANPVLKLLVLECPQSIKPIKMIVAKSCITSKKTLCLKV